MPVLLPKEPYAAPIRSSRRPAPCTMPVDSTHSRLRCWNSARSARTTVMGGATNFERRRPYPAGRRGTSAVLQTIVNEKTTSLTDAIAKASVQASEVVREQLLQSVERNQRRIIEVATEAASAAAKEASSKAVQEATDLIEVAADNIGEASTDFDESMKRVVTEMGREMDEAAGNAVERAVRGMRDDVREALNDNLDEYKKRLHETGDQNMDILRAEMKAVVTAQVDRGVDAIALRVEGLVVKMESAAAGLAVAAKKALTAARDDDSRDNSPAFFKASLEPALPRVGVIAEELQDEENRAEEIRRSREPGYIALAPKVASIFDDEAVLAR